MSHCCEHLQVKMYRLKGILRDSLGERYGLHGKIFLLVLLFRFVFFVWVFCCYFTSKFGGFGGDARVEGGSEGVGR